MKKLSLYFSVLLFYSPFIFCSDEESGCSGRASGGGRLIGPSDYNPDARRSRGNTTEILESEIDSALRHKKQKPEALLCVQRHLNPDEPIIRFDDVHSRFQYATSTNKPRLLPGIDIDPSGNLLHSHQDPKPREVVRTHFLSDDIPPYDFATEHKDDSSLSFAQKVIRTFCGADIGQIESVKRSGILGSYSQDRPVRLDTREKQKEVTAHNLLAALEDTIARIQHQDPLTSEEGCLEKLQKSTATQTEAYNELFTLLQWYSKAHKELHRAGIHQIWKDKHKDRLMNICEYIGRHLIEAPLKEYLQLKTKDDDGAAIISVSSRFLFHARLLEVVGKHIHTSDISEADKTNTAEYKKTIKIARAIVQRFYEDQEAKIARLQKERDDEKKADDFYKAALQKRFLQKLHTHVLEKKASRTVRELKHRFTQWRENIEIQHAQDAAQQAQAAMQLEDAGNPISAAAAFISLVQNPQTIRDIARSFDRFIESVVAPRAHTHSHEADPVKAPGLHTVTKDHEEDKE